VPADLGSRPSEFHSAASRILPSAEELIAHQALLQIITNPIWLTEA
jgi:hypothetical protein